MSWDLVYFYSRRSHEREVPVLATSNAVEEPTLEQLWTSTLQRLHAVSCQLSCNLSCNSSAAEMRMKLQLCWSFIIIQLGYSCSRTIEPTRDRPYTSGTKPMHRPLELHSKILQVYVIGLFLYVCCSTEQSVKKSQHCKFHSDPTPQRICMGGDKIRFRGCNDALYA